MSMFCHQCQETARNTGCTVRGVCGKLPETAKLQDLLLHCLKGLSLVIEKTGDQKLVSQHGEFITEAVFTTITNANFDDARFLTLIPEIVALRDSIKKQFHLVFPGVPHDSVTWVSDGVEKMLEKAESVGILATENEDIRSLRSFLVFGIKGISAYAHHAAVLGYHDVSVYGAIIEALAAVTKDLTADQLLGLLLKAGNTAVTTMALLDKANTATYGNPEITKVNIGVRNRPGILISGHDLKDLSELLEQTKLAGVDVYTHSEMLPSHYYPAFKKYEHFVGNYGSSWWHQNEDFEKFNGPIIMTTNCIIPIRDSYKDRIFTTGAVGYPGVKHIPDRSEGGVKDFSQIIELAKKCPPPTELERGEIVGGFAHHQVLALADKVVAAIKSGAIKRFIVMAGCDGRHKTRDYFTQVAEALPKDTIILTAGCAKYRYNKLNLGDIGGIPRVLDAGQCNDCYSLAVIALTLKDVFGLADINQLPISFDVAWYEQKAVAVLLALLALGVKGIRLGPTLPGFLSSNVAKIVVEKFNLKLGGDVQADVAAMMAGN